MSGGKIRSVEWSNFTVLHKRGYIIIYIIINQITKSHFNLRKMTEIAKCNLGFEKLNCKNGSTSSLRGNDLEPHPL